MHWTPRKCSILHTKYIHGRLLFHLVCASRHGSLWVVSTGCCSYTFDYSFLHLLTIYYRSCTMLFFLFLSLCLFSPRSLSAHNLHRFFYHFAMHFYSGAFFLLLTLVVVIFVVAFSCRFFSMRHIFKSQIGNNRLCAVLIITCIQCTA